AGVRTRSLPQAQHACSRAARCGSQTRAPGPRLGEPQQAAARARCRRLNTHVPARPAAGRRPALPDRGSVSRSTRPHALVAAGSTRVLPRGPLRVADSRSNPESTLGRGPVPNPPLDFSRCLRKIPVTNLIMLRSENIQTAAFFALVLVFEVLERLRPAREVDRWKDLKIDVLSFALAITMNRI